MSGPYGCERCAGQPGLDFTFAFQPIVDVAERRIFAYEALVRGPQGQGAGWVLEQVNEGNQHRFDQDCRMRSIILAQRLGLMAMPEVRLSINFMPSAVYEPERCLRSTLATAAEVGSDPRRLVFEVLESDQIAHPQKVRDIFDHYAEQGFLTAIDDFGAGYAGLTLLLHLHPKLIKLDMELVRDVDQQPVKQALIRGILQATGELGIGVIAEGIEREEEARWLAGCGVRLMQGYFFARPALERLLGPEDIRWPAADVAVRERPCVA